MLTHKDRLKDTVEAKRKALEARLSQLKADTRKELTDERVAVEKKLDELKKTLSDGWEKVSEATAKKLDDWLSKN